MCRYAWTDYSDTYVCFECRRVFWGGRMWTYGSTHCGSCGAPGANIGKDLRVPRRNASDRKWRLFQAIVESRPKGWGTCGCDGPGRIPQSFAALDGQPSLKRKPKHYPAFGLKNLKV